MPLYEHVFLARQDVSAQQVEELTAQFKGVIEQMGGKVAKTEYWGVKSLTYRIRKNRKAHFTLLNVDAPPAALNEIERQERINEDVLRYLTIRVDELEEGPSAMMRKVDRDRERDDRGDRGDRGGPRRTRSAIAAIVATAATATMPSAATTPKRAAVGGVAIMAFAAAQRRRPPAVLPPPQDLPVLRRQRAEDRLQGRQAAAALRLRARQDRAEPHHRGVGQEAARARAGDQARALPRPAALRDP